MALPPEVEANYTKIIDSILSVSDLNTISEKRIRKGLETVVQDDLTPQKHLIRGLIMARFDKFHAETSAAPSSPGESPPRSTTNGNGHDEAALPESGARQKSESSEAVDCKPNREKEDTPPVAVETSPKPPKKKRKVEDEDEDARLAAMLQAEENSRARKTRGAATRKAAPAKKRKVTSKAKSATKVEDDSDAISDSERKKKRSVNRSGGFHKQLTLSAPLAQFLGETTLSRPETVKRLWAYFKENELQDPKDRRQIRCDDALKAIFKQERVHMFTMNKLLSDHLFTPED
ncbi:MAG: hypothetical protein M1816_000479 [Peltula sp. TS41687]|nr:MAG: hypothetical protein M1816_000479 [Peltula sp. TS41687]